MTSSKHDRVRTLVLASLFLAAALLLPFLTGQIPQIGNMLCPMHIPVLLCGFFCGPWYGLGIGLCTPMLRFVLFGMPPLYPTGLAMAFELAAYGLICGLGYRPVARMRGKKRTVWIYIVLLAAMLAGRAVWGAVSAVLYGARGTVFTPQAFLAGAFTKAVPGIILQIAVIPPLVAILEKNR